MTQLRNLLGQLSIQPYRPPLYKLLVNAIVIGCYLLRTFVYSHTHKRLATIRRTNAPGRRAQTSLRQTLWQLQVRSENHLNPGESEGGALFLRILLCDPVRESTYQQRMQLPYLASDCTQLSVNRATV
jgi:hypothetical protein